MTNTRIRIIESYSKKRLQLLHRGVTIYSKLYFHIRYGLDAAYWIVIISFYCLSRKFMLYFTVFIVLYGRNFCG